MKNSSKQTGITLAALGIITAALASCGQPTTSSLSETQGSTTQGSTTTLRATAASGYFSTSGKNIIDSSGKIVRFTGANWFGFETGNYMAHALWQVNYKTMLDKIKSLGLTMIRLPYSDDIFTPGRNPQGLNTTANAELVGKSSLEVMDAIINYAGQIDLRILLDRHRPDAGGQSELWYTGNVPETTWINNLKTITTRYKNNPAVIGIDLHNEPHGNACWGCGDQARDWRLAAERGGNAVLGIQPNWLIIVEGVDSFNGSGNWWGGNLQGAKDFPVRLNVANRLVYSAHDYGMSVSSGQPWFNDGNFPNTLEPHWDKNWGYILKQNIAPVLVGEFGSTLTDAKDRTWMPRLLQYMQTNGASWTFWSLNPNSGDTKGLLQDDWTSTDNVRYDVIKPFLVPLTGGGTGGTPTNNAPSVSITSPTNGSTLPAGTTSVSIKANASDSDGSISSVKFFNGANLIATDTSAPFEANATGLSAGNYSFKAVATDNQGASSESGSNVTVASANTGGGTGGGTGTCKVQYLKASEWNSGATVNVTVTNTSSSTVNGWTIAWNFANGQQITQSWNGTHTQSGSSVNVKNMDYNSSIAANGGSINFGFNLAHSGNNPIPSGFTLNGTTCQ